MSVLFFHSAPIAALSPLWATVGTAEIRAADLASAVGGLRQSLEPSLVLLSDTERQPLQAALQRLDDEAVRMRDTSGNIPRTVLQPALESLVQAWPARFHDDISTDYFVGSQIAEGGCARIHRGMDLRTGNPVAIKVVAMPTDVEVLPTWEALGHSLREEYNFLARLAPGTGPCVLRLGTLDGKACMVMELLEGPDLHKQWDEIHHELRGDRGIDRLIAIGRQAVAQIAALHRQGIVHCDVKPNNFKYHDRTIRAFDFGLALPEGQAHAAGISGTPDYMSPESFREATTGFGRDVFALGVTLYWLLTGQLPFDAESWVETRAKIMDSNFHPEPPSAVLFRIHQGLQETLSSAALARLRSLEAVIMRAMNRDPNLRFQNAEHMVTEFQRLAPTALTPFAGLAALGARRRDLATG